MSELGNKELSGRVIEAAIAVHTALGPGFIGRSQMKAAGIRDGLMLNFATMPLSIKRIGPGGSVS